MPAPVLPPILPCLWNSWPGRGSALHTTGSSKCQYPFLLHACAACCPRRRRVLPVPEPSASLVWEIESPDTLMHLVLLMHWSFEKFGDYSMSISRRSKRCLELPCH